MCFVCALTICKLCSWKVTKKRSTLDHPGTVAWSYRQLWVTLWVLGTEMCLFQEQHALLNTKLFLKAQAWLTAGKKRYYLVLNTSSLLMYCFLMSWREFWTLPKANTYISLPMGPLLHLMVGWTCQQTEIPIFHHPAVQENRDHVI